MEIDKRLKANGSSNLQLQQSTNIFIRFIRLIENMTPLWIRIYAGFDLFLFGLFLILAIVTYEYNYYYSGTANVIQYDVFSSFMSELGSYDVRRNPKGWFLFSIALWSFGILLIGEAPYINRKLLQITERIQQKSQISKTIIYVFTVIATLSNIFTGISVFFIGCFTIDNEDIHYPFLISASCWYSFAQAITFVFVIISLNTQKQSKNDKVIVVQTQKILVETAQNEQKQQYFILPIQILAPFLILLAELILALIFCIPYWFSLSVSGKVWSASFWEWLSLLFCLAELECATMGLSFGKWVEQPSQQSEQQKVVKSRLIEAVEISK